MRSALFRRCLDADYIHTAEGGDYAVQYDEGTIYLLFEWSDGVTDWRRNLDFPVAPYKRMEDTWYCHRGFLKTWRQMRDEVEGLVAAYKKHRPVGRITCVGYSHGAALALLATEDMAFLYGDRCAVSGVGFGCPRVVWGRLPRAVKDRLAHFTSVRNVPDIVTHLPPAALGYRHVGLVEIGEKGRYSAMDAHRPEAYLAELER